LNPDYKSAGKLLIEDEEGLTPVKIKAEKSFQAEISIYDESNPDSVMGLLGKKNEFIRREAKNLPEELRHRDPFEFRKEVDPSPTINKIRIAFWTEYDRTLHSKKKMQLYPILKGICSVTTFKKIISDPVSLAWILTPVQSYDTAMDDLMETCLYKMRQAIDKLHMTESKDIQAIMKVYEAFDKRKHGEYTQRIEKKEHIVKESYDASKVLEDANIGVIEINK